MPNSRRPGWRTSTYTAPATLITAAQARAAKTGDDDRAADSWERAEGRRLP